MPDKRAEGTQLPGAQDVLARAKAEKALRRAGIILHLEEDETSISVTPALITDPDDVEWAVEVVAGNSYRFAVSGKFTTAAVTTGIIFQVAAAASAAGTCVGWARAAVDKQETHIIVSRTSPDNVEHSAVANALPITFTTPGVTGTGQLEFEMIFICSTSGTINFLWGSEVPGSEATLLAGSSLLTQYWN